MWKRFLAEGEYNYTVLRAGIIVGSGSASFEIIRDLVEKMPIMLAPKWALTKSHPIAIRNVMEFLSLTIFDQRCYNKRYDIGGPDILTYKDMLLQYAEVRGMKRRIIPIPFMTERLSAYWLYFVTAVSYKLAANLVDSMKVEVIGKENNLSQQFGIELIPYKNAISMAFTRLEQNDVVSTWKDSLISGRLNKDVHDYVQVPQFGVYRDFQEVDIVDIEGVMEKIWSIGGETGWYYATWIWNIRGFLDKLSGGIGIRRGRTNLHEIHAGDALDFWRVLLADQRKAKASPLRRNEIAGRGLARVFHKGLYAPTGSHIPAKRCIGEMVLVYAHALSLFYFQGHGKTNCQLKKSLRNEIEILVKIPVTIGTSHLFPCFINIHRMFKLEGIINGSGFVSLIIPLPKDCVTQITIS